MLFTRIIIYYFVMGQTSIRGNYDAEQALVLTAITPEIH